MLAIGSAGLLLGSAPGGNSVTVTVTDVRNAKGVVRACITNNAADFPDCKVSETSHTVVAEAAHVVTLKFENIAPGTYAIALTHDENNNGKMDRALLLMPKEGYGFSRDAKVVMAPPKFKAAAFAVESQPIAQTVKMRYML